MIPSSVTAWAALVHDRYLADMVSFLRANPCASGLMTWSTRRSTRFCIRERSVTSRRVTGPKPSYGASIEPGPARAGDGAPRGRGSWSEHGTANALALWFGQRRLAPGISLSVGPGDPPTHWGMTTAPLNSPVDLTPGMVVRARVRTTQLRPIGTWTSWAIALPGAEWEEHDEQHVEEIDD